MSENPGNGLVKDDNDECTIPVPIPASELNRFVTPQPAHEARAIREYVEWQAPDEQVVHLEKVMTEHLPGQSLDAWDVHTTGDRYWVITDPTNLYSQKLFPSLDYTITFHIGLAARISARQARSAPEEHKDRLLNVWRRWEQASEALDQADEAEEFQAVGMRCRECLIMFARVIADQAMVPDGRKSPDAADFAQWSELIADAILQGSSAERMRSYVKCVARSTWSLVNWLTHHSNATRFDGAMAVSATQSVLVAFGTSLMRYESGLPDRCPQCSSYRVTTTYDPGLELESPYVVLCENCGWSEVAQAPASESP